MDDGTGVGGETFASFFGLIQRSIRLDTTHTVPFLGLHKLPSLAKFRFAAQLLFVPPPHAGPEPQSQSMGCGYRLYLCLDTCVCLPKRFKNSLFVHTARGRGTEEIVSLSSIQSPGLEVGNVPGPNENMVTRP